MVDLDAAREAALSLSNVADNMHALPNATAALYLSRIVDAIEEAERLRPVAAAARAFIAGCEQGYKIGSVPDWYGDDEGPLTKALREAVAKE